MPPTTLPVTLIFSLSIVACHRTAPDPQKEATIVYRTALEEILLGPFVSGSNPKFLEKIDNQYWSEKIDSSQYAQIWDSLATATKNIPQKCVIEYSPLPVSSYLSREDLQCSMTYQLHDRFFSENFDNVRVHKVLETLTENTTSDWASIAPSFVDFIKHDSSDHQHPYGKTGLGVIALSSIYFNEAADHAILFVEYQGGHQNQRGALCFLEKSWGRWEVVAFRTVWIT